VHAVGADFSAQLFEPFGATAAGALWA